MAHEDMKESRWSDLPLIAIDIETSGQYPFSAHICEMAAVRTRGGVIEETFSQLIKPPEPMSDFVIGIHGISNEMVADAPPIAEVIGPFMEFIKGGVCMGHHVPFDATFISTECEKAGIAVPDFPLLCTSLLSRNLITGTPNHRLQTLIKHFSIKVGAAHRALDDSVACFRVFEKCMEQITDPTLKEIEKRQTHSLRWSQFSFYLKALQDPVWKKLVEAQKKGLAIEFSYSGGSRKGKSRKAEIVGLVINPTGAYMVANDGGPESKRFYKNIIIDVEIIWS